MTAFRRAFVFGSNGSPLLPQLRFAESDAQRFAAVLGGERFAFAVTTASDRRNPYAIKQQVDRLAESCTEDDTLIIYFSGHGELRGGQLLLVLDETDPERRTTYLPASWLTEAQRLSPAKNRLLVLDCCHAGALTTKGAVEVAELPKLVSESDLLVLASHRLEIARELASLGGSFLTHQICTALSQAEPGPVALGEVMRAVQAAAVAHNRSCSTRSEPPVPVPFTYGEVKGDFYFAPTPPRDLAPHVNVLDCREDSFMASAAACTAVETAISARDHRRVSLDARSLARRVARAAEIAPGVGEHLNAVMYVVEQFGVEETQSVMSWKARAWRLPDLTQVSKQLNLGRPVVAEVTLREGEGWYDDGAPGSRRGVITPSGRGGAELGRAAVVIVAKRRDELVFANCWGAGWGEDGFGTVRDDLAPLLFREHLFAVEVTGEHASNTARAGPSASPRQAAVRDPQRRSWSLSPEYVIIVGQAGERGQRLRIAVQAASPEAKVLDLSYDDATQFVSETYVQSPDPLAVFFVDPTSARHLPANPRAIDFIVHTRRSAREAELPHKPMIVLLGRGDALAAAATLPQFNRLKSYYRIDPDRADLDRACTELLEMIADGWRRVPRSSSGDL